MCQLESLPRSSWFGSTPTVLTCARKRFWAAPYQVFFLKIGNPQKLWMVYCQNWSLLDDFGFRCWNSMEFWSFKVEGRQAPFDPLRFTPSSQHCSLPVDTINTGRVARIVAVQNALMNIDFFTGTNHHCKKPFSNPRNKINQHQPPFTTINSYR